MSFEFLRYFVVVGLLSEIGVIAQRGARYQGNNYGNNNNYFSQRSSIPSVEVQQITAEWVCNNLVTGETKFFGVEDFTKTHLSPNVVEGLLGNRNNQGRPPPTNNQNFWNPNQNQPVIVNPEINPYPNGNNPQENYPIIPERTTEKPISDGSGLIDIRLGD